MWILGTDEDVVSFTVDLDIETMKSETVGQDFEDERGCKGGESELDGLERCFRGELSRHGVRREVMVRERERVIFVR